MPLRSIESLVQRDHRLRSAYAEGAGIYRILPAGVALPASVEELQALVRWAAETGTALTARGAGSGIPGSAVGAGVIVDLRERMPRRLEVDGANRTAITSANITQLELNTAAAPYGLRLPPDPSSSRWATLGGMVSTNAAGPRTVRYGPARNWVDALEIVMADGDVTWLERGAAAVERFRRDVAPTIRAAAETIAARFPRTRKNTAGYALDAWLTSGDDLDLFIGAEGTLGLITTIRWRLDPIPAARAGLRISLARLDQLEAAVQALVALDPSAVELLDRTFLDLVRGEAGAGRGAVDVPEGTEAVLLVEFERGDATQLRGVVGDAVRAVKEIATDIATALTPEEEQRLWALRHAASPILASLPPERRSLQVVEDGCVPLSHLGEYAAAIRAAAQRWRVTAVIFGHAGDGHLHVNLVPELAELDWPARVRGLYTEVSAAVIRLGGTVSGEHGDGRLRAALLPAQYGPEIMELFELVKTAFDPDGIFNPGVKLPRGSSPFQSLKVGLDVTPIPEDIALALREIERTGGYARSRVEIAEAKLTAGS
ncbi:MAG: FAD-binding oxidoreductase [Gemmatimonadota bacterium]|nr:FAD-binding oxidoreductase [Gemmatimonadota bacterium]